MPTAHLSVRISLCGDAVARKMVSTQVVRLTCRRGKVRLSIRSKCAETDALPETVTLPLRECCSATAYKVCRDCLLGEKPRASGPDFAPCEKSKLEQ